MDWFDSLIDWLGALFQDFIEFIYDLPIFLIEGIVGLIVDLIVEIPVPEFLEDGMAEYVTRFPDSILWAMGITRIDDALAIVAAGVAFRLLRKLLTLGQW